MSNQTSCGGTETGSYFFFFFFLKLQIQFFKLLTKLKKNHIFMAALGLRCCTKASSSVVTGGSSLVVVASLIAEHGL